MLKNKTFEVQKRLSLRMSIVSLILPTLFILMWSSGYIAGAIALRYATPLTMTTLRFIVAAILLLLIALATKAPWPKSRSEVFHILIVGLLIQSVQFGGLYLGIKQGVPSAISALIVGMMPILTAIGAKIILGERINWRQWVGLILGLLGVTLVLSNRLLKVHGGDLTGIFFVVLALLGITSGALYQKRFCSSMDLRTGNFLQLSLAAIVMSVLATTLEPVRIDWTGGYFAVALLWMSIINSIGAISVMYVLLRRGEASRVASLFYLIPPVTAIMSAIVLHEAFTPLTIVGFTYPLCFHTRA